jgi:ABC-type multidrug transport system ATPase subunit
MLQVLLVLSLLLTHDHAVLLIDEPDAHLHLILQRAIYGELRSVAAARGSQLLIATHSEQVIDTVDPRELCLMYGKPRLVADTEEKAQLVRSLGGLTHGDLLHAEGARGVLYTEDFTDLDILEAFARALDDKASLALLTAGTMRKRAKACC